MKLTATQTSKGMMLGDKFTDSTVIDGQEYEADEFEMIEQANQGGEYIDITDQIRPLVEAYRLFTRQIIRRKNTLSNTDAIKAEESKWISVEDRLPILPTFVIAYKSNGIVLGLYYSADKEFRYGKENQTNQVTHWQLLPSPPQSK